MIQIAIFASGSGSNAEKIAAYFQQHPHIRVSLIVTDNPNAGVIQRLERYGIPTHIMEKGEWRTAEKTILLLKKEKITHIVLAGYLKLIPLALTQAYPKKIINIHPALLPKYGGKGMYGIHIHAAVVANKERESGITIHFVDEQYDNGEIIFQAKIPVSPTWDAQALQFRVLELEHEYFPKVIEEVVGNIHDESPII